MRILIVHYPFSGEVKKLTIEIVPCNELNTEPYSPDTPDDMFRCFVCLEMKTPKHYAGRLRDRKVCRECWRFVDDWKVGCLILFDRKRGFAYA